MVVEIAEPRPDTDARPAASTTAGDSREAWTRAFAAIAAGDPAGLDALYDAAADRIYGLALWRTGSVEDASDVVQEVFLRVVEARSRLERVDEPVPWLLGLARHAAVDVVRRAKRRRTVPLDGVPFLEAASADAAAAVDASRLSRLLGELPASQRDAIYLKHFEELTFAAIGKVTGVPTFTAASRYRLGLGRLRRLLEGKR